MIDKRKFDKRVKEADTIISSLIRGNRIRLYKEQENSLMK